MSLQACASRVFRVFQQCESYADRATGAAGPFFVFVALGLIVSCVFTFFEVVFPRAFLGGSTFKAIGGGIFCAYMVYCFCFHYYMAICVSPGSPADPIGYVPPVPSLKTAFMRLLRLSKSGAPSRLASTKNGHAAPSRQSRRQDQRVRICKKCPPINGKQPPKPERTHHCSVCGKCFLKFDHHCPWINGCVGLHNERYFLLFECYLSVSCGIVAYVGWPCVWDLFNPYLSWDYRSPRVMMLLLYLVVLALGAALLIMAVWQLWLIARGETTVESSDNDYYRQVAKAQGKTYVNPYDFGKLENIREFFNVGQGRLPSYTIFLPLPYPPATDGWNWRHRPDAGNELPEDLTSDEDAKGS